MSLKFNAILDARPDDEWPSVIKKTDFKQVLKFFRLLDDDSLTSQEKTICTINIFFGDNVPNDPDIFKKIQSFIMCGKEDEGGSSKKVFDWNEDHGRIFSAFWQVYGIDLRNTDMHWWTFCELFENLPENTKLMQVIDIRGRKVKKGDSEEYKKSLREMQNRYRLDSGENELESFFDRL